MQAATTYTRYRDGQPYKAAFPGITFSVRIKRYSGGSSIDVCWTDGPTAGDVETVAGRFKGSTFDGMIDLRSYHDDEYEGERVHFGVDFVTCQRRLSVAFVQRVADELSQHYGVAWITVTDCAGDASYQAAWNVWMSSGYSLKDAIFRELSQRPYTPPIALDD